METKKPPAGSGLMYLVAIVATGVSADTSLRFFRDILGITSEWELFLLFGVLELFLIACGYATRVNVRQTGKPGAAKTVAWALCGLSAYMAIMVSGVGEGIARVALGPVLAIVALHLALGIDIRAIKGDASTAWAKVVAEIKERLLSRLGLGDDSRDAATRTRDRARERAARLAVAGRWTLWRRRRLARAVRASGAALNDVQKVQLVTQVAALRHLDDLATVDFPSPWREVVPGKFPQEVPGQFPGGREAGVPGTSWAGSLVPGAPVPGEVPAVAAAPKNGQRTDEEIVAAYGKQLRGAGVPVPAGRVKTVCGVGSGRAERIAVLMNTVVVEEG